MERLLEDRDRDILRFNYEKLHESIWENHKVSWIVTSIFIPIIFAMQGYFIKDYFSALNTLPPQTLMFQVLMGAFVIQSLAVVWWLIMKIFAKFNKVRFKRLKEIEGIFFKNKIDTDTYPVKQYEDSYTLYMFDGKDHSEENNHCLKSIFYALIRKKHPDKKHRGCKVTFTQVYDLVLIETFVINLLLILYNIIYF